MVDQPGGMGALLRATRQRLGFSLSEMASRVHTSKQNLSYYEKGDRSTPQDIADAYARIARDEDMKRRSVIGMLAATPLAAASLGTPEAAEMAMKYGLWLGDRGELAHAQVWYDSAFTLADWTGDSATQGYIRARVTTRGLYEGWTRHRAMETLSQALSYTDDSRTVVEAHASLVQIHTKDGDLTSARAAGRQMLLAAQTDDDHIRSAVFVNYLECMIGDPRHAPRVYDIYQRELETKPVWWREAQVYQGMAIVRQGGKEGVGMALDAVCALGEDNRMVGIGVTDLLAHVTWRDSDVDRLHAYARV